MTRESSRRVCDYEGSRYRTEFWGEGRAYEDGAERVALQHMLPPIGHRLIDIGGGYGRLVPLYDGYEQVVIFDYALSQLRQARDLWGTSGSAGRPRYIYVAGDFYRLPFAIASFDTVVMVRTLHHATDVPSVLRGVTDILAPDGSFVLEFANKRNLKAILRYLAGRQDWSPFDRQPVEFAPLNFDFHPAWIEERLAEVDLQIRQRRAVSSFRLAWLKRLLPTGLLVTLDRIVQPTGELLPLSPSIFVRCETRDRPSRRSDALRFRCPGCGSTHLQEKPEEVVCLSCGRIYPIQNGIYNFKTSDTGTPRTSLDRPLGKGAEREETSHEHP
jgi:SAM-dependent methyltransferase